MDQYVAYFLKKMGPAFDRRCVPESTLALYRGRLPDQLLSYWDEFGWCGYADGIFWTVNPQDYEPVLEAWIGDTLLMEQDAYHIIARSAFGDLYLWGEKTGASLSISTVGALAFPKFRTKLPLDRHLQMFFSGSTREENDFADCFAPAMQKFGRLKTDEMYGFVPALAVGGSSDFNNLQKVKAIEHLVILAQLSELELMNRREP